MVYVRLLLTAVFWGGTFVAGRVLVLEMQPFAAAFWRFLIASLTLLPLLYLLEGRLPRLNARGLLAMFLLGATGVFAYNALFFYGLRSVEAGRAALVIAGNPVAIAIASAVFYRERYSVPRALGVLISLCGSLLVISRGEPAALLRGEIGQGELFLVGCVLSFATYTILGKRVLRGFSPLAAVAYSCVAGTVLLAIPALQGQPLAELSELSAGAWASLLFLALLGTVAGFIWYYDGVARLGPTNAGLFINFVPVSAIVFGYWLLNEPISLSVLFGGMLVVAGVWLTNRRARQA